MEQESSPKLPPLPAGVAKAIKDAKQIVADCKAMLDAYQDAYDFAREKCGDGSIEESARDSFSGQLDTLEKNLQDLGQSYGDLEDQCEDSVLSWSQYNQMHEQPAAQLILVDMIAQAFPKLNRSKNIFIEFRDTFCKALEAQAATQEKAAELEKKVSTYQTVHTPDESELILIREQFQRYCEARDKALLGFASYQQQLGVVLRQLSFSPKKVIDDTADAKKEVEKGADEATTLFSALKPLDGAVSPAINGYADDIAETITQAAKAAKELATKISGIQSGLIELATQLNAVWARMAEKSEARAKSLKKAAASVAEEKPKPDWQLDLQKETKQPKRQAKKSKKGKGKKKKHKLKKPVDRKAQEEKAAATAAQAEADKKLIAAMAAESKGSQPEEKSSLERLRSELKLMKKRRKKLRQRLNKQGASLLATSVRKEILDLTIRIRKTENTIFVLTEEDMKKPLPHLDAYASPLFSAR